MRPSPTWQWSSPRCALHTIAGIVRKPRNFVSVGRRKAWITNAHVADPAVVFAKVRALRY